MGKKRSRDVEGKDVPEDPAVDKMEEDDEDAQLKALQAALAM